MGAGTQVIGSVVIGAIMVLVGYLYFAWSWGLETWHFAAAILLGIFIICPILMVLGFTLIGIMWMVAD